MKHEVLQKQLMLPVTPTRRRCQHWKLTGFGVVLLVFESVCILATAYMYRSVLEWHPGSTLTSVLCSSMDSGCVVYQSCDCCLLLILAQDACRRCVCWDLCGLLRSECVD